MELGSEGESSQRESRLEARVRHHARKNDSPPEKFQVQLDVLKYLMRWKCGSIYQLARDTDREPEAIEEAVNFLLENEMIERFRYKGRGKDFVTYKIKI